MTRTLLVTGLAAGALLCLVHLHAPQSSTAVHVAGRSDGTYELTSLPGRPLLATFGLPPPPPPPSPPPPSPVSQPPSPPPPPPPPPPSPDTVTPSPERGAVFEPLCQVTFGKAACVRGEAAARCPDKPQSGAVPTSTGAWTLPETYTYFLDRGMVGELGRLFANASVLELGAGKGCYAAALRRNASRPGPGFGVRVRAYDGSPDIAAQTAGLVQTADLTAALALGASDWVLCLEVAEHIPRPSEERLLANLHAHNRQGVVLSWSNNAGGNGHVTLRTNEWAEARFGRMGYVRDLPAERALRRSVSNIHWFRETLLVFRRRLPLPTPY